MSSEKSIQQHTFHPRAFTLVEVLFALVIIGALVAIVAFTVPRARAIAHRAQCASNMRQIGAGLLTYAADNGGNLPNTTHVTGRGKIEQSWIYVLEDYLGELDVIRICPAEDDARRKEILKRKGTSYLLNDLLFDDFHQAGDGHHLQNTLYSIPFPNRTLMAVIGARPISVTWDHAHCGNWHSWGAMLEDVAVDRHGSKSGRPRRQSERIDMEGSANYLFADGHVNNTVAADWKKHFEQGINPGAIPR